MIRVARLKPYLKQAKMMFQDVLIYRADFISRYIAWGVRFMISAYLWLAILNSSSGEVAGYDLKSALTYFLLMQIITGVVFTTAGFRISDDIQYGDLSPQLILPMDYLMMRMWTDIGRVVFFFISNLVIYSGIAMIFSEFFNLNFEPLYIIIGLYTMAVAFVINFCINASIGMLAFWTASSRRLIFHFFALITLVSGIIVPLEFFPELIQKILLLTPFPYLFYFPAHVIQAGGTDPLLLRGIIIQAVYAFVLVIMMYGIYARGIRSYEAVGR